MPEIKKQPIASAVPDFNADSAYAYVANQVAFGPRVPNTAAHKACGDYLASELKRFGAKVYQQEAILTAYDGTKLEARNIIGSFDPENSKRILLFAHWDSRPYSDHDPDPSKHRTPLDGADDGGSGVGAQLYGGIRNLIGYGGRQERHVFQGATILTCGSPDRRDGMERGPRSGIWQIFH